MTAELTDDDRVRDALAEVGRAPGARPSDLVRAGRRTRLFLAVTVVVVVAVVGVVVVVLALGSSPGDGDRAVVPAWQQVIGTVVAGGGLVLQLWGLVRQLRGRQLARAWSSPLFALTRAQRKDLLAQARGRGPVDPGTVPLAALTARTLVAARLSVLSNAGFLVLWIGLWLGDPAPWRTLSLLVMAALLGLGVPVIARDARRGQRFLAAHTPW